jgi:tRNA(His) 5'-end guanylyltransferase
MGTLKYYLTAITQFFKRLNSKTKLTAVNADDFEFTYPKLGINLNQNPEAKKGPKSLLTQMYSEDNEALFI